MKTSSTFKRREHCGVAQSEIVTLHRKLHTICDRITDVYVVSLFAYSVDRNSSVGIATGYELDCPGI
jgi:hypothetical protein